MAQWTIIVGLPSRVTFRAFSLSLERLEVSEAFGEIIAQRDDLEPTGAPRAMDFDATGNLAPMS
jgi:hypothetical protein